ncbi:MAG: 3'(2'),5'-bisphosphate nucleotidase CysQ [Candidatus Pacebacteria bacterium]|nr:3'(2'),5'-bisphosphate nucleotidase CysQ [Candidatus Paceibacterota bacterium]
MDENISNFELEESVVLSVLDLVKKAGEGTLDFFKKNVAVEKKEDDSPVTEADYAANTILMEGLKKYGYPILSEEIVPHVYNEDGYLWIIDPLDGTKRFIKGESDFSVMVGLTYKTKPIFGIVYQPAIDVLYYAEKGKGAFVEKSGVKTRIQVSDVDRLAETRLTVSNRARTIESFARKVAQIQPKEVHYVGSNGVKIGGIAEGKYDLFFNPSSELGSYDYCAPHMIIEEAGGKISHCDGSEVLYDSGWDACPKGVVVSNGAVHDEFIDLFKTM